MWIEDTLWSVIIFGQGPDISISGVRFDNGPVGGSAKVILPPKQKSLYYTLVKHEQNTGHILAIVMICGK